MPTAQQKLVKVGDDIVAFPSNMENDRIAKLVKSFREKKKKSQPVATEESEHARQLKDAQPLSTAIPSLPDWANKPLVGDKDLEETPQGKALTAKSQKEFESSHPQITSAINKGNNPVVLGALSGTNEFVKGMQTPASMALLLGALESKILSGIFSVQALRGSYKDAQSARKAFDEGKNEEAIKYATQALLGAGVGALAGTHAYKGLPEGVRTRLASEEGSMALPNPTTAYKAVDQSQPFYLKSENLIQDKMKGPMPAEDVHKMLLSNGVKPEEMQWTGLDELLKSKGKGKVTPQEVQEHLAGNNLQIREVEKGTGGLVFHNHFPTEAALMQSVNGDEMLVNPDGTLKKGLSVEHSNNGWNIYDSSAKENPTKFGSYSLPGGENYRELLLTIPETNELQIQRLKTEIAEGESKFNRLRDMPSTPERQKQMAEMQVEGKRLGGELRRLRGETFRSSHWDEPNVLGHIRFNDRVGPNGEKILHLEELQSDMMQAMRKQREIIAQTLTGEGFYDIIKKMQKDGEIEVEC